MTGAGGEGSAAQRGTARKLLCIMDTRHQEQDLRTKRDALRVVTPGSGLGSHGEAGRQRTKGQAWALQNYGGISELCLTLPLSQVTLSLILRPRYWPCPHFIDEHTEAQGGELTSPARKGQCWV